jgi:signal transduction histidine kinase
MAEKSMRADSPPPPVPPGSSPAKSTPPDAGRDLAARAAVRELERENERLRGDLRTLGRRFSHDLRTPLNCISAAGGALGKPRAGDDPAHAALATSLLEAVGELAALIDRVSFVLKATADPPQEQPVAMREAVGNALLRLESRIRKDGATVVPPESWPRVVGVPSWLEVIWKFLIENSLEHGGPAARIELGWIRDSTEFLFRVRDHGGGVPPEERGRLFAPFDSLHELNAPRGLGLPIVRRLVELQGGRCFFEPPVGAGASFYFTLPASAP